MKNQEVRNLQSKGIRWNTITSVLILFIQVGVSYFLNKIIAPGEFGKALWAFFVFGLGLFFSNYSWFEILIRAKKISKSQYSTAFLLSWFTNGLLFILFFFGADWIDQFSKEFSSKTYLKAYSFLYLINAMVLLPHAKLTREIEFKILSQFNISAKLVSSIMAIILAIYEKPFLSLFFLYMGTNLINYLLIILYKFWIPKLVFDRQYFQKNFNFATTLTLQKLANAIGDTLDGILVGKSYSESEVGSYTKSYGVRSMPVSSIARSVTKVTLPTLSKLQDSQEDFEKVYFSTQHFLAFLLFPVFGVLFFLARPFTEAYFDEDWDIELIINLLRIFAVSGVFASFQPHFNSLLFIKSSSKTINTITFTQRIIFITLVFISLKWGLIAIAFAKLISSILDFFISGIFSNQYFSKNYFSSTKDFLAPLLNTLIAGVASYYIYINLPEISPLLSFLLCGTVFGILYLILAYFIDQKGFRELKQNFFSKL